MALLQIQEPNQSKPIRKFRLAAGIDLGTTNSLIATVLEGKVQTLTDDKGCSLLPSVVHYGRLQDGKTTISVGQQAKKMAVDDPFNTVSSVKRLIGRSTVNIPNNNLPYTITMQRDGIAVLELPNGHVNPIQVSSHILAKLARRATALLEDQLEGVVVTVPAYFDDSQRQATKDAATLAGLNVLRLLNEPTAAAIAYGLESKQEGIVVVYDIGGGTFDISVLRLCRGIFEVLATAGNTALGGDDFDQQLIQWIEQQSGMGNKRDPYLHQQIVELAVKTKIALSNHHSVTVTLKDWQDEITREQFNDMIAPLVRQTLQICRQAVKEAGTSIDEIVDIVLVGGSSKIPYVQDCIGQFFRKKPLTSIDPERVVVIGAAIQADMLIGNKPISEMLLLDVTPLSLGIETMGGLVEKIIPRNSTIPCTRIREFTTFKDGQTAMILHIVQGERETVKDCRSLAKFILKSIPPKPAGTAHIQVTFQVDADGLLSVTATEQSTAISQTIYVKPSYGLSDNEIAEMIKDSLHYANEDKKLRKLAEQKIKATSMIETVKKMLKPESDLITEDEIKSIIEKQQLLQYAISQDNSLLIEQYIKELDDVYQPFALRQINFSIKKGLTGRHIDEIDS